MCLPRAQTATHWCPPSRSSRDQVSELLRLICEANLDAFSRHSLEHRAEAARETQVCCILTMRASPSILSQKRLYVGSIFAEELEEAKFRVYISLSIVRS